MKIKSLLEFMAKYKFQSAEWDGKELTMYDHKDQPWTIMEFVPGSPTRDSFETCEDSLIDNKVEPFTIHLGKRKF